MRYRSRLSIDVFFVANIEARGSAGSRIKNRENVVGRRRPSLLFFPYRHSKLSSPFFSQQLLTFSPFLGVGATLSIGRMVVEGVAARATTEEGETR